MAQDGPVVVRVLGHVVPLSMDVWWCLMSERMRCRSWRNLGVGWCSEKITTWENLTASTDFADGLVHEEFIDVFDSDAGFDEKWAAAQRSGIPPIDGVYTMLDVDNQYVVGGRGFVRIYRDATPGDRHSGIVVKAHWDKPAELSGGFTWSMMKRAADGTVEQSPSDQFLWVPSCSIVSAFSTLRVPDAWLGGYAPNVARNSPTMVMAGTMVHSFSPHQRP
jgi:hypothetical protein